MDFINISEKNLATETADIFNNRISAYKQELKIRAKETIRLREEILRLNRQIEYMRAERGIR